MRVAVLGARGQLGAAVALECQRRHEVIPFNRSELDVTDASAVADAIDRSRADVIVNCTGYNAVDAAETHPVEALAINGLAVPSIARNARHGAAVLAHCRSGF